MNDPYLDMSLDVETLEEQLESIIHELDLALQWKRPSILFAIYNSNVLRKTAQDALETLLLQSGQDVVHFQIEYEKKMNLTKFLEDITHKDKTVFYIDPLNSAGNNSQIGNLIAMLNSCRGFVVDHLVRVVFWLTENEALTVAHQAPDFWASRHRVFEFFHKQPARVQETSGRVPSQPVKGQNMSKSTSPKFNDADIQVESPLVFDLPDDDPTFSGINMLLMLGVANWKEGNQELACEPLNSALVLAEKSGNKAHQIMCHKAIALVKSDSGMVDEAIQAYNRVIELCPENITIWNNLGSLYQKAGRFEDAFNAFTNALKSDPNDPVSWNGLGNIHANAGRLDDAINCYRKAIQFNAGYIVPWIKLADVLSRQNRDDDALYAFMRIVEMDQKNVHAWSEIGSIYLKAGSYEQSIDAYKKALMLGDDSTAIHKNLAYAYTQAGYFVEAIPLFQKSIELENASNEKAALFNMLGDVYRRVNDYENAVAAYEMADKHAKPLTDGTATPVNQTDSASVDEQNNQTQAPNRLDVSVNTQGSERDFLIESLQAALGEPSELSKVLKQTAAPVVSEFELVANTPIEAQIPREGLHALGQVENPGTMQIDAEPVPSDLPIPNPEKAILWARLGSSFCKAGAIDRAVEAYHKAVNADLTDGHLLSELAQLNVQKMELAEAISNYRKSIELFQDNKDKAVAFNNIGNLYRQMKEFANALEAYEAAISLDPENKTILSSLGQIQADLDQLGNNYGQGDAAGLGILQEQVKKSAESSDKDMAPEAPKQDVVVSAYVSQPELFVKINLDNPNVWNELGNIFIKSKAYDEAIEAYHRAIELDPESGWSYSNLALVLACQGKRDVAVSLYQKSIELLWNDKDKAVAWDRLGDVFRQAGQYPKAIEAYQNADKLTGENYAVGEIRDVDFAQLFSHFVS